MLSENAILDLTNLSAAPEILFAKINKDKDTIMLEAYYKLSDVPSELRHKVRGALGFCTSGA